MKNLLFFLLITPLFIAGQDAYRVKFRIEGLRDTICLITRYYGNGNFIEDTLKVDQNGKCEWITKAGQQRGMYSLVINEREYFDFVLNNDLRFSAEAARPNPAASLVFTNSPENALFREYYKENMRQHQLYTELDARAKINKDNKDTMEVLKKQFDELNKASIAYKLSLAEKNPESFLALMINVMKEPEIPEIPILPNGRKDSLFAYNYYRNHFWDGTDFADDRTVRTPVFHNKVKKYFDQVVYQQPDSIIRAAHELIERSRPSQDVFRYMIWFTTSHYERSEIMGMDKVFVYLVDTYYVTGQTPWIDKVVLENVIKRANKIRPLLIGQVAPNMIMTDTSNQLVSMHNIDAKYLILYFWDPDCSHCEQEAPQIRDFYDRFKDSYGVKIFSVCSDTSLVKWKQSIIKRRMDYINVDGPRTLTGDYHEQYDILTTPTIYILNRRKEIIAKHLRGEQLEKFIQNYDQRAVQP